MWGEGVPPWYPQGSRLPPLSNRGKVSNPFQRMQPPDVPWVLREGCDNMSSSLGYRQGSLSGVGLM